MLVAFDLWAFVSVNRDELFQGFLNTLKVSAVAIAGAFVIGLVLGAARAHRVPVVSQLTAVYVEVIRNTPILVQIFMLFYGLPQLGMTFDAFTVAWLSVMLWGGAFNSENFRAGFGAVSHAPPRGGLRARLRPARHVPERDAAARRPHRAAVVDQHLHLGAEEHVADVRHRLPELTTTAINISNITLETAEALTFLGIVYLTLVWSISWRCAAWSATWRCRRRADARLVGPARTTSCARGCRTRFGWRRSPSSRAP